MAPERIKNTWYHALSKGVYLFSKVKECEFGWSHDFLVRDKYVCGITVSQPDKDCKEKQI